MADRLPTIGTWLDPVEVAQFEDGQRTGTESGHYDLALPDGRRFDKVYDTVIDQFNASIEEISVKIELTEHAAATQLWPAQQSPFRAVSIHSISCCVLHGLTRKATAPALSTRIRTLSSGKAVMKIMGTERP